MVEKTQGFTFITVQRDIFAAVCFDEKANSGISLVPFGFFEHVKKLFRELI